MSKKGIVNKVEVKGEVKGEGNGVVIPEVVGKEDATSNSAPVVKADGRGARPGVPHITARIMAMSEADRETWLKEKCGTPEIMQEVRARLDDAIKNGREHSGGGKVRDYDKLFAGRPYSELVAALPLLTAAIEAAKSDEAARLEGIIAKAEAEKARLRGLVNA